MFVSSTVYDASLLKLLCCLRFLDVFNFCYEDLLIIHIQMFQHFTNSTTGKNDLITAKYK